MKPKVYLETTIPSYLAARPSRDLLVAAHQQITRDWWESRRSGFDLFVSELVVTEARAGDAQFANRRLELLIDLPVLPFSPEILELAEELITAPRRHQPVHHRPRQVNGGYRKHPAFTVPRTPHVS